MQKIHFEAVTKSATKSHNQNQEGEVITNVILDWTESVSLQNIDYIMSLHNSVINQYFNLYLHG